MSRHDGIGFVAGDDWELRVTLQKADGSALDLSGSPDLKWTLLDRSGNPVIAPTAATITVTDAPGGKCKVTVPSAASSGLPGGLYSDALRVAIGGVISTPLYGDVNVMADPFATAVMAASVINLTSRRAVR